MTAHREWLTSFDPSKKSGIKLANSSTLAAEDTGNVVVRRKNGGKVVFADVLYVPEMDCNLMSIGQLSEWSISRKGILSGN
jgi:hypothetical protein